jgi:transcriptional regulator with XRE-family HTH domain
MTANVVPLASRRIGEADDVVRATIRANLAARSLHMDELAGAIGMSRSTMYRRLTSRGHVAAFTAGELAAVAQALDVPIADLFEGRVSVVSSAEMSVNNRNLIFPPAAA